MRKEGRNAFAVATISFASIVLAGPALAQSNTTSQPVVQAIPTQSADNLSAALRAVSSRPRDVQALLRAGDASLGAGDIDAAQRFYKRVQALLPRDPFAKLGLAAVAVRKEDPFTALRLFDEVQASGLQSIKFSGDHGLAYDLLGDFPRAQRFYREALTLNQDPQIMRRLALSQAIGGDLRGAESTLLPLLRAQDKAAFRTRAFALAIAGKQAEAMSIAETLMPTASARRLEPYLNSMPRLTPAQQAAAGNFGHFPLAAKIGFDDPRIAAFFTGVPVQVASEAGDRLVPQGEPFGMAAPAASAQPNIALAPAVPVESAPASRTTERVVRRNERDLRTVSDPLARTRGRRTQVVSAPQPAVVTPPAAQSIQQPVQVASVASSSVAAAPGVRSSSELPPVNSGAASSAAPVVVASAASSELPAMVPVQEAARSVAAAEAAASLPQQTPTPAVEAPSPSIDVLSSTDQLAQNAATIASTPAPTQGPSAAAGADIARLDPSAVPATPAAAMAEASPASVSPVGPPAPIINTPASAPTNAPVLVSALPQVAAPVSPSTPAAAAAAVSASPTASAAIPNTLEAVDMAASSANSAIPVQDTASDEPAQSAALAQAIPTESTVEPVQAAAPQSVADAFAGFDLSKPATSARAASDAVDLTTIEIPVEKEATAETASAATPAASEPSNPSRVWVQIATGQDRSALRFDFRRIARKAPELFEGKSGFTAKWNATNRLVTGPFDSASAARRFVNDLKEKEIASFTFTSEAGQEVEPLPKR